MHGTEFIAKSMKHFWQKDCENTVNAKHGENVGYFSDQKIAQPLTPEIFVYFGSNLVSQRL